MTPFTFAVLITSLLALAAVLPNVKKDKASTNSQKILFFSGIFGFVWSFSTILSAVVLRFM